MIVVAIAQTILHYLGWACVIFAVIAFLFGNSGRSLELLIGAAGWFALKYTIGAIFLGILYLFRRG